MKGKTYEQRLQLLNIATMEKDDSEVT